MTNELARVDIAAARTGAADLSFNEIERVAQAVADSGMFGMTKPAQAMVLMMLCRSEGKDPIQACRQYHIINGKPTMRADAMLAEFQARGGKVRWGERTDQVVSGVFSHDSGGDLAVTWTIEDAQRAGLVGPGSNGSPTWKKFPRQMLTARVISEAVRTILPGVVVGIYTPEEVADFETIPAAVTASRTVSEEPFEEPAKDRTAPLEARSSIAPPPAVPAPRPTPASTPAPVNGKPESLRDLAEKFVKRAMEAGIEISMKDPAAVKDLVRNTLDYTKKPRPEEIGADHYHQALQHVTSYGAWLEDVAKAAGGGDVPETSRNEVAGTAQAEVLAAPDEEYEDPFDVPPAPRPNYADAETAAGRARIPAGEKR